MKQLYESILRSTNAGRFNVEENIKKWLRDNNLENNFRIEKDLTLTHNKRTKNKPITIIYDGIEELPSYINFNPCDSAYFVLKIKNKIKSFRGLPAKINKLQIETDVNELPSLNITIIHNSFGYLFSVSSMNNKKVVFDKSEIHIEGTFTEKLIFHCKTEGLFFTGSRCVILVVDGVVECWKDLCEELSTICDNVPEANDKVYEKGFSAIFRKYFDFIDKSTRIGEFYVSSYKHKVSGKEVYDNYQIYSYDTNKDIWRVYRYTSEF